MILEVARDVEPKSITLVGVCSSKCLRMTMSSSSCMESLDGSGPYSVNNRVHSPVVLQPAFPDHQRTDENDTEILQLQTEQLASLNAKP